MLRQANNATARVVERATGGWDAFGLRESLAVKNAGLGRTASSGLHDCGRFRFAVTYATAENDNQHD
jgi:hypothetical protein